MENRPNGGAQSAKGDLPQELVCKWVNNDNLGALRLCSKALRDAVDSNVRGLQVMYGSVVPSQCPPEPVALVEQSLRGLLTRGCQPHSLRLRLDDEDADREAKGLAVLRVLSASQSLKELRLHNLPLSTHAATLIGTAAPSLTKLSLGGDCTSGDSLHSGLAALLRATPQLEDLTLSNLTTTKPEGGSAQPAWQAMSNHAALRSLDLHLAVHYVYDAAAAEAMVLGLGSLTQLQALSLNLNSCWEPPLTALLLATCSTLTRLRSLSLYGIVPPDNLLQCLASLPHLESLNIMRGWGEHSATTDGVKDVSYLPQLTALTRLCLSPALSPSSLKDVMDRSPDATWALPPQLRVLRLNQPLTLLELGALNPPSSLQSVTLSPEAMRLPDTSLEAAQQLAAAVPRLAACGVETLALTLRTIGHHDVWIRELAPLQLRRVRLCSGLLREEDAEALADALGASLQELTLEHCGSSLLCMLPGLLRMRGLRTLVVISLPDREDWERLVKGPKPLRLVSCASIVKLRTDAAQAATAAAAATAANAAELGLASAVQEVRAVARPGGQLMDFDFPVILEAVLLVLLARGVNVLLKEPAKWVTDVSREVSRQIRSAGDGAKWGSL